jgi:hypothetical protein
LLAVTSALGLLCGCATHHRSPAASAVFQSAECPSPNFPGLPDANLGPNYSCGYLSVPENRSATNGRRIRLLVARVKAATVAPRPDPIVFLSGGPGGAGTLSAPGVVASGMNADREIIFVNQRARCTAIYT